MTEGHDRDEEAAWFEEEVMGLLPDLLSAARYMADRRADAEDVVAEAVARAWEKRDDLRDRERFRGWIFRILRNCYLGRQRKRDRRPDEVPLRPEGEEESPFSLFERLHQPFLLWWGDPEEQFFDRLLQEDLERAVEALPEVYRSVLVLADVQGLSYAEIADALDVPVGTVRSRLSRARSRLQEALWEHAVDAGLREPRDPDGSPAEDGPDAPAEDAPDTAAEERSDGPAEEADGPAEKTDVPGEKAGDPGERSDGRAEETDGAVRDAAGGTEGPSRDAETPGASPRGPGRRTRDASASSR